MPRPPDGFGLAMVLGVVAFVASLGLALGLVLESATAGVSRAVDRSVAYHLAEGIVERAMTEYLVTDPDWTDLPADTLYRAAALDRGACTLVASNRAADRVDVLAEARYRRSVATLRLRVQRSGPNIRWERLDVPYIAVTAE